MKLLIGTSLFLLIGAATLLIGAWIYLPNYLRQNLETAVHERCSTCELSIGALELSLFPLGGFILHDIHFVSGDKEELGLRAKCEELTGQVDLTALLKHEIVLDRVLADKFEFILVNGDKKSPKTKDRESDSSPWGFVMNGATFKNGGFVYTRNTEGTSATLHIHDINIHLERFGTIPSMHHIPLVTEAHLRFEKSGDVKLKLEYPFSEKPLHLKVQLEVRDQNLEDLNPFFEPNAGVNLKGILERGQGLASLVGTHLTASVSAKYKEFTLKLLKSHDRSEIAAFFTSLGASILMNEKNTDKPLDDRTREVLTDRKADESIVSFLLRGLKEAAIKVAEAS